MNRSNPALGAFTGTGWLVMARLTALEAKHAAGGRTDGARAAAVEKVRTGEPLTRAEVAAYLGVSTKKIQRMDSAGTLQRCPGLGSVVRYSARDVLRLASASAPKGA